MAELDLKDSMSSGKITRYTATMTMSSVVNTTKLATIDFSRAYRSTPRVRNIGTDSAEGISVSKGVNSLTPSQLVVAFRQGSPTLTTDTAIIVYADVDGEF